MASLKSGRKFDTQSLQEKIDSPKKQPITIACSASVKLGMETHGKKTHRSTSEFVNDILERVLALLDEGGTIEDIKQATSHKKLENSLAQVSKAKEELERSIRKEKAALEAYLMEQKQKVARLEVELGMATKKLQALEGGHILIPADKQTKEIYSELETFRIVSQSTQTREGVFLDILLHRLASSNYPRPNTLKKDKPAREYLEALYKEHVRGEPAKP